MPKFKKISFLRILLGLITVLIGAFVVGYITELTAGDFRNWIESIVGKEKVLPTLIGLGLFSVVLLLITYLIETKPEAKELGEEKKSTRVTIEKAISDTRTGLTESYQNRLDSKMAQRLPINLQLKYTLEGTTTKAPLYDNRTIGEKSIKEELISIFDKHRGRLLIIGDPGSGKTTLLLQLAVTLLEREERAIPIIINIATWRERFKTAEVWLEELLPQMGISKSLVQLLIKENRILPLLDGLDELAEENRKPCLEALGEFGKFNELKYVICSRKVEYAQTVDAPVYCEVAVRPLLMTQIIKQLIELGTPEASGLVDAITKDDLIRKTFQVPFYLNTTQFLFSSMKTLEELDFKTTNLEERKKELVKMFIDQQLRKSPYSEEKSNHWLSFLAHNMNQHNHVVFGLADLQYSWNSWSKKDLLKFRLSYVLFATIILSFILGGSLSFLIGLGEGLKIGFIAGIFTLFFLSIIILFFGVTKEQLEKARPKIKTTEIVSWSFRKMLFALKNNFQSSFVSALAYCIPLGLVASFFLKTDEGLLKTFFNGIFIGILWGLIMGSIFTPFFALKDILKNHQSFIRLKKPYQRFTASLIYFNFSIIKNFMLRIRLWKKELLPLKLVPFLNALTESHIFESDGATWRFRHKILQDYFADMWEEEQMKDNSIDKEQKP